MLLGSLGLLRVFLVIVVVIVLAFAEMSGVLNQLIRQRCFLALRQLVFLQRGWLVALEQILGRRGGLRLLLLLFLLFLLEETSEVAIGGVFPDALATLEIEKVNVAFVVATRLPRLR